MFIKFNGIHFTMKFCFLISQIKLYGITKEVYRDLLENM